MRYEAVAIGCSAGGMRALKVVLSHLTPDLSMAVLVVIHRLPGSADDLERSLDEQVPIPVRQASDKEAILPGTVYVAPPDYHLMVETDRTLSLSVDPPENHARPSADVLFETAADAYGPSLVAIVLTGANSDGAAGLAFAEKRGGLVLVQAPDGAEMPVMPLAAIAATRSPGILPLDDIGPFIRNLNPDPGCPGPSIRF